MSNYKDILVSGNNARSVAAEAFRTLRTNLQYSLIDKELKSILVTSAGPGEGKSLTVANIAITLAQTEKKVIVLDCDLRCPQQHLLFGRQAIGLTNVLSGQTTIADCVQATDIDNLQLVASGSIPPNPSELLGSEKMQDVLVFLKGISDYLIIDTPPVLPVTDACVLTSKVDGTVLVLGSGMVCPGMAQRAKDAIVNAKGTLLGLVVNKVRLETAEAAYYHYYNKPKTAAR